MTLFGHEYVVLQVMSSHVLVTWRSTREVVSLSAAAMTNDTNDRDLDVTGASGRCEINE